MNKLYKRLPEPEGDRAVRLGYKGYKFNPRCSHYVLINRICKKCDEQTKRYLNEMKEKP